MIETIESRAEFEKRRKQAQDAMRAAMKGELPLRNEEPSNVKKFRDEQLRNSDITLQATTAIKKAAEAEAQVAKMEPTVSRAEYMRNYRRKLIICPKCKHQFKEIKRAS